MVIAKIGTHTIVRGICSIPLLWSSHSSVYFVSDSMTLSSLTSELGFVVGAEENDFVWGFIGATTTSRGPYGEDLG
jgi:hypothetical protein